MTVIAATLLPFAATKFGDRIDHFVAPCGTRHGRVPVNSAAASRDTAVVPTAAIATCHGLVSATSPPPAHGIKQFVGRNLMDQFRPALPPAIS